MGRDIKEGVDYIAIEDDRPVSCPEVQEMTDVAIREEFRKLFGHYPDEV